MTLAVAQDKLNGGVLRLAPLALLASLAGCATPLFPTAGAGGGNGGGGNGAPAGDGNGAAEPTTWNGLEVHGTLTSRVRHRTSGDDDDLDVYEVLSLEIGDSEKDPFTGHFLGTLNLDLDGDQSPGDNGFFTLDDTYDRFYNGRVVEAYFAAHDFEGLEEARLGRQSRYDTPEFVTFDGVSALTRPRSDMDIQVGVYAGRPFHFYESSPSGDAVAGVYAEGRPWQGGRVRLDYMYLEDELQLGDQVNDLAGLSFWQSIGPEVQVRGKYNALEGESRDAQLGATWVAPEHDLIVQVDVTELMNGQRQLSTELDPYFVTLQEYVPYRQGRIFVSKGIGDDYVVDAGADVRKLDDEDEEGPFNHDWERYYVSGTAKDVCIDGVSVTLTGELWNDEQSDYGTFGLDVTREVDEMLRLSAGTFYALFKDDFYLQNEREDVRTYYVRARIKRSASTSMSLGYELEDADLDTYHTVTARMTWRF